MYSPQINSHSPTAVSKLANPADSNVVDSTAADSAAADSAAADSAAADSAAADSAAADSAAVDTLVEQVMQQALEQLTTLTGLNQRQALQLIANKYNIPIEQSRNARIIELLNDEESQFIGQLFN